MDKENVWLISIVAQKKSLYTQRRLTMILLRKLFNRCFEKEKKVWLNNVKCILTKYQQPSFILHDKRKKKTRRAEKINFKVLYPFLKFEKKTKKKNRWNSSLFSISVISPVSRRVLHHVPQGVKVTSTFHA